MPSACILPQPTGSRLPVTRQVATSPRACSNTPQEQQGTAHCCLMPNWLMSIASPKMFGNVQYTRQVVPHHHVPAVTHSRTPQRQQGFAHMQAPKMSSTLSAHNAGLCCIVPGAGQSHQASLTVAVLLDAQDRESESVTGSLALSVSSRVCTPGRSSKPSPALLD